MNETRRALLTRRALSKPTTTAGLLTKARALADLERESVPCPWNELPEERREPIRDELLEVIAVAERLGTYEARRASDIACRLLEELDGEAEDEDPAQLPPWRWDVPAWTDDDRLVELKLNLLFEMAQAVGFDVGPREWANGSSARVRWLQREGGTILEAIDPLQAWLAEPPQPARA